MIPLIQKESSEDKSKVSKLKLRPIIVVDTARRILVTAYQSKVKEDVQALCASHQLNVLKGGYDLGINAERAELKKCL